MIAILIAVTMNIAALAIESLIAWLALNLTLPIDRRCSYARMFSVLFISAIIQYPIGHWHLLGEHLLLLESFVLLFFVALAVLRLSLGRTLLGAIICWIAQFLVGLGIVILFRGVLNINPN